MKYMSQNNKESIQELMVKIANMKFQSNSDRDLVLQTITKLQVKVEHYKESLDSIDTCLGSDNLDEVSKIITDTRKNNETINEDVEEFIRTVDESTRIVIDDWWLSAKAALRGFIYLFPACWGKKVRIYRKENTEDLGYILELDNGSTVEIKLYYVRRGWLCKAWLRKANSEKVEWIW
ncbi:hypothetical protein FT641_19285 [Bacillus paranthracis]|uniref:hypothetical protein n=1 Tax=Bacillus paranthracis TaxID=2026186 RepID=UPI001879330A|nr:hypothetical protein [Bacillus paranthracis]MBE7114291.1 hypothetical protein [Bacillus paranthracis]MBE7154836.1 hypothetical protein [Bacillus paranthracis]